MTISGTASRYCFSLRFHFSQNRISKPRFLLPGCQTKLNSKHKRTLIDRKSGSRRRVRINRENTSRLLTINLTITQRKTNRGLNQQGHDTDSSGSSRAKCLFCTKYIVNSKFRLNRRNLNVNKQSISFMKVKMFGMKR